MAIGIKEAARVAVSVVADLFDDQAISNVKFEEINRRGFNWLVTVGFDRVIERNHQILGGALSSMFPTERTYKVVEVDSDGDLISVTDRMLDKK
ncbi:MULTISPECIES: hypothetical protein [Pseudomonas]|uniref:hypothetical protein n=1 Tax=Pseudomonas TaxID=286 RepID=UPI0019295DB6|nr:MULTISPECIES: hypothetical protein [Pseudomonas]QQX60897.1 hypothetical protein JHW28_10235 [Pseudomonas chlororaphis subsp. aurantiaca]UUT22101.1 hypothetical protein NRG23_31175 [Pseudomonas sp. T8]